MRAAFTGVLHKQKSKRSHIENNLKLSGIIKNTADPKNMTPMQLCEIYKVTMQHHITGKNN